MNILKFGIPIKQPTLESSFNSYIFLQTTFSLAFLILTSLWENSLKN